MQAEALASDWRSVDTIPLKGEGEFLVLTFSGLHRVARNWKTQRKTKRSDGYGPARTMVRAVESGNYLAAIAWKWPD